MPVLSVSSNNSDLEELELAVIVRSNSKETMTIALKSCTSLKTTVINTLIDCGVQGQFIDGLIIDEKKQRKLARPVSVRNIDGS